MHKKTTTTILEEYPDHAGTIRMTVSLITRLLEWAKSEAADDTAIHYAIEKMAQMAQSHRALTIEDFDVIIKPAPTPSP